MTQKAWGTKEKIDKMNCINIINFCAAKDSIKKVTIHRMGENIYKSPI